MEVAGSPMVASGGLAAAGGGAEEAVFAEKTPRASIELGEECAELASSPGS